MVFLTYTQNSSSNIALDRMNVWSYVAPTSVCVEIPKTMSGLAVEKFTREEFERSVAAHADAMLGKCIRDMWPDNTMVFADSMSAIARFVVTSRLITAREKISHECLSRELHGCIEETHRVSRVPSDCWIPECLRILMNDKLASYYAEFSAKPILKVEEVMSHLQKYASGQNVFHLLEQLSQKCCGLEWSCDNVRNMLRSYEKCDYIPKENLCTCPVAKCCVRCEIKLDCKSWATAFMNGNSGPCVTQCIDCGKCVPFHLLHCLYNVTYHFTLPSFRYYCNQSLRRVDTVSLMAYLSKQRVSATPTPSPTPTSQQQIRQETIQQHLKQQEILRQQIRLEQSAASAMTPASAPAPAPNPSSCGVNSCMIPDTVSRKRPHADEAQLSSQPSVSSGRGKIPSGSRGRGGKGRAPGHTTRGRAESVNANVGRGQAF